MDEETIVINDLLSFIWCKTKTTPKNILLKCVEAFYSEQFAIDALHSLITAVPYNVKRDLSTNPFEAIIDYMENTPADHLPTFVCRNLNNVPDIDFFSHLRVDNGLEDDIYMEHKRLVGEIDVLNKSLSKLSDQLNMLSEKDPINNFNEVETVERRNKTKYQKSGEDFDIRTKKIKIELEYDGDEEPFDAIEDVNYFAYDELRVSLIANRYQRALARNAEKGNEEKKMKKFKPILFDSIRKDQIQRSENVLSPDDTIFPSSCKINIMNSSVAKKKRISSPFESPEHKKSPSGAEDGSSHGGTPRYLSEIPTPDYKVLNVLCAENSPLSQNSNPTITKPDTKEASLKIQYPCPLCSNGFFEEDWMAHVRCCQGDGSRNIDDLRCPTCNCFFADKKMLGFHMGYHDIARQHGCNECGYRFYTKKALEGHMKLHSPLCKNKCPFCNFKTFKAGRVKEHVRSHTGEKPFKCTLCDYASTTYDILRGHIKSHSVIKEYFKCNICDKTYSSKGKLKAHEQSHIPHERKRCNLCKNGYHVSCISNCRKAMQMLFPCPECSFRDRDINVLRHHMKDEHPNRTYATPSTKRNLVVSEPRFKSSSSQNNNVSRSPR